MVFIPRRFNDLNSDAVEEIRPPLVFALAIVAVIGWALAAYLAAQLIQVESHQGDPLSRVEVIQGCGSPL